MPFIPLKKGEAKNTHPPQEWGMSIRALLYYLPTSEDLILKYVARMEHP